MAEHDRHAAWQATYEVRGLREGEPPVDLGLRFAATNYTEAVEYAFDFLETNDPSRDGAVAGLEIVRVGAAGRETVWSYRHGAAPFSSRDLVRLWGFDPTRTWHGPGLG